LTRASRFNITEHSVSRKSATPNHTTLLSSQVTNRCAQIFKVFIAVNVKSRNTKFLLRNNTITTGKTGIVISRLIQTSQTLAF